MLNEKLKFKLRASEFFLIFVYHNATYVTTPQTVAPSTSLSQGENNLYRT